MDAWSRLSEVRCPVLVVAGDLDMAHIRARAGEVASRIAGAQLRVMHGAAHLPGFEQPEAFAAVLREFLDGPTGREPTGRGPTGRGPTGRGPTGRGPTGREPTGREPTGREPTGRGPTGREPTGRADTPPVG
jgi:hypothetical protein